MRLFHPVFRGEVEYRRAFVYPTDIQNIPDLVEELKADYDVNAPGIFAIRELRRNSERLAHLVGVVYWTTFLAAIVTIFIVTVMNVYQRMPMIGVLRLVGLPPSGVLWVITVRNLLLMLIGAALIVLIGLVLQFLVNSALEPGTCRIHGTDYLSALAMVVTSCVIAFVYSGLRAAQFDPVRLVDHSA